MFASDLIKAPNMQVEFTPDMIQELKKCAADPVYFACKYVRVQHPTKGTIPLELYEYQKKCIRAFMANRWSIVKCGRQMGKTTVIAVYLLWFACFKMDKYVLVASNKNAGAVDIMNRIRFAYEELPLWLKPGCKYYNKHSIEFDNGSTIISSATTENTGRGRSISLLMLDELAFVPKRIQDAMWSSIAPTLSTGGSCIVSSTPNGDSELFAHLWREAMAGVNGFEAVEIEWDEHPDRDESYREMMKKKIGEDEWLQEYECQFLSSDPLLIKSKVLQAMKAHRPIFTDKGFNFWKEIDYTKSYLVSSDVAEGVRQDFSTIEVFELDTLEQVAEYRRNDINESQLYNALKWILEKLVSVTNPQTKKPPQVYWSFENNSAGAAIGTLYYNDEKFPDVELINSKEARTGMRTTNKPKIEACRHLKNLVERQKGGFQIRSKMLIEELKNYVASGASYAAKIGSTDDLVSAMLIMTRMIKKISEYEPDVFDKLYKAEQDFVDERTNEFDDPMPFMVIR